MFHSEGENSVPIRFFLRFDFMSALLLLSSLELVWAGESWESLTEYCRDLRSPGRGSAGCKEPRGVCTEVDWSCLVQNIISYNNKLWKNGKFSQNKHLNNCILNVADSNSWQWKCSLSPGRHRWCATWCHSGQSWGRYPGTLSGIAGDLEQL